MSVDCRINPIHVYVCIFCIWSCICRFGCAAFDAFQVVHLILVSESRAFCTRNHALVKLCWIYNQSHYHHHFHNHYLFRLGRLFRRGGKNVNFKKSRNSLRFVLQIVKGPQDFSHSYDFTSWTRSSLVSLIFCWFSGSQLHDVLFTLFSKTQTDDKGWQ